MNMKKRILSAVLALCLTVAILPVSVSAASSSLSDRYQSALDAYDSSLTRCKLNSTEISNMDTVYTYLTGTLGLNTAAACGVMANMVYESRFSASLTTGKYLGILQWDYNAVGANSGYSMSSWMEENGYELTSLSGQLAYLKYHLTESKDYKCADTYSTLTSTSNSADGAYNAGYYFCYYYERPSNKASASTARGNLASQVLYKVYGPQETVTETPVAEDTSASSGSSGTTDSGSNSASSGTADKSTTTTNTSGSTSTGGTTSGTNSGTTSTGNTSAGTATNDKAASGSTSTENTVTDKTAATSTSNTSNTTSTEPAPVTSEAPVEESQAPESTPPQEDAAESAAPETEAVEETDELTYTGAKAVIFLPFTQVSTESRDYTAVCAAYQDGTYAGSTTTSLSPDKTITRAQIVQVMYNAYLLEGNPATTAESTFSDVEESAWYADAVAWAQEAGIVSGVGGNRFSPDTDLTREQFALMLYQYNKLMGQCAADAATSLDSYSDSDQLTWSNDAMEWAVACGLIEATADEDDLLILDPQGACTQAMGASIISCYFND
jgi:hypothetical protein